MFNIQRLIFFCFFLALIPLRRSTLHDRLLWYNSVRVAILSLTSSRPSGEWVPSEHSPCHSPKTPAVFVLCTYKPPSLHPFFGKTFPPIHSEKQNTTWNSPLRKRRFLRFVWAWEPYITHSLAPQLSFSFKLGSPAEIPARRNGDSGITASKVALRTQSTVCPRYGRIAGS